jgi:hypothetical protein|tara:strand:- start:44 stop:370 length:327 start_codon:yes stop_codon:yes gene_type:complete
MSQIIQETEVVKDRMRVKNPNTLFNELGSKDFYGFKFNRVNDDREFESVEVKPISEFKAKDAEDLFSKMEDSKFTYFGTMDRVKNKYRLRVYNLVNRRALIDFFEQLF